MSDVIIKELDKAKIMVLSVQGENHKKNGICNQDSYSFKIDNSGNYAFVVADGVSTCKFAKEGAEKACEAVCNLISDCSVLSEDEIKQKVFTEWKKLVGEKWNDYGTTINFVYVYTDRLVMGKVGDGAVLVKNGKNTSFLHEEADFYTSETFALGESIPKEQFMIVSTRYEKLLPILHIRMVLSSPFLLLRLTTQSFNSTTKFGFSIAKSM